MTNRIMRKLVAAAVVIVVSEKMRAWAKKK
jgi:hypothetical protein